MIYLGVEWKASKRVKPKGKKSKIITNNTCPYSPKSQEGMFRKSNKLERIPLKQYLLDMAGTLSNSQLLCLPAQDL